MIKMETICLVILSGLLFKLFTINCALFTNSGSKGPNAPVL